MLPETTPSRAPTMATRGVVTSSHQLASFVGASVLKDGGNIVDAAIATSAVLCVVQNNMCGLGGDMFALISLAGKAVSGINGSGRAGAQADIDFYRGKGFTSIPQRGPLAALTVPGLVHAWGELHKRYGSIELAELLKHAINYAEDGVPLTPRYVDSIVRSRGVLGQFAGWSRIFLPGGKPPVMGSLFRQRDLAISLKTIAEEGCDTMYKGSLAERMSRGIESQGGILTAEDFSKHNSSWTEPLKTVYKGVEIYETAPNSQGATVLLWLNMLERFDLRMKEPSDVLDTFVKTYLVVNEERRTRIADPEFVPFDKEILLKSYAEGLRPSQAQHSQPPGLVDPGDTTYFAVGDSEGNCISWIQSNYMGFGSGLVPEGTGIVLHNRGCYFSLNRQHHNRLEPNKRTFHTLCASIGLKDGSPMFCIGDMGGDVQPQVHVQLMTNLLDRNMDIQSAIDAPRWCIPATIYERPSTIQLEQALVDRVKTNRIGGFDVERLPALSSATGHAQGIVYVEGGISAGADPRGDGAAVGL